MRSPLHPLALLVLLAGCVTPTPADDDDATGPLANDDDDGSNDWSPEGLLTSGGTFAIDYVSTDGEHLVGLNEYVLTITSAEGDVLGATVTVVPYMGSMGHGTPTDPLVVESGSGAYEVTDVRYTMPGPWELQTTVSLDGVVEEAEFEVQVLPVD